MDSCYGLLCERGSRFNLKLDLHKRLWGDDLAQTDKSLPQAPDPIGWFGGVGGDAA